MSDSGSVAGLTADESECRPDGTHYKIVSGPTGGDEEWYEVRLTDGANGFARGREHIPVP